MKFLKSTPKRWGHVTPRLPPRRHLTLSSNVILSQLSEGGSRPALICPQEKPRAHGGPTSKNMDRTDCLAWDYAEFDRNIDALARGLIALGVKSGERVGVIMGNNSAYALLQWACASVGAILVTINPAYRTNELIDALRLAQVNHLVLVPHIRSSAYLDMLYSSLPGLSSSPRRHVGDTEIKKRGFKAMIDWRELFIWSSWEGSSENYDLIQRQDSMSPNDVVNMQFTRYLTHYNLLNNGFLIGEGMKFTNQDVLANVPPLFHCFDDLVLGNLAAFTHGATVVYPSPSFDPPAIVDAVIGEECTALHGVPTHFLGVLKEVDRRRKEGHKLDFSRLRTGIAAGSTIPIELMKKLINSINLTELTIAYGMMIYSPVSFQTVPTDPLQKRTDTVGRIHPHVTAKVVNPESGEPLPINTPGELWVSGYLLQKGYWNDRVQTDATLHRDKDGVLWMKTGDEGIMDEDGYLSIVGRIKDIIIRGGENLFPVQIENALLSHPSISEAAAVSVPDATFGEVVGVWIILAGDNVMTKDEVRKCVTDTMNPQNAPAWVWFVNEGELPKTASGKIQKHILRTWSKERAAKGEGLVTVS
ncbi:hypothetical protein DL96DRAFT_1622913 [Flagelloscypha sp. PMI_526]|nr:hypothetical protein DL96DRAFT_1622913 [Flagelloscypha sp. PMI_526]